MGETFFRFKAGELTSLRIVCKKCNTVLDVPIDNLMAPVAIQCICGQLLQNVGSAHLSGLAVALKMLASNANVEVQFSLPVK